MEDIVNISAEELEKARTALIDTYESLSLQQCILAKRISFFNYYLEDPLSHRTGIKGFSNATVYKNGVIKVTVYRTPERVKLFNRVGTQYYKEIKDFWQGTILNALSEIENLTVDGKAYVVIEICHHPGDSWDVDNHNIKFIVDAIRYAGIIKNDTYKDISYHVFGKDSPEELTNIFITQEHTFFELLKEII